VAEISHDLWQKIWSDPQLSFRLRFMQSTERNRHLNDHQKVRFKIWLQKQFTDRCQRNSRYSLRAFAQAMDLDASTVSQFLSGKRAPSRKALLEICERLSATPQDLRILGALPQALIDADEAFQLSVETFAVLSDWYHFAILELTFVAGFKPEPKWIARQLGISVSEASVAIARLRRLNLLAMKNGQLVKTHETVTNHTGLNTSAARKNLQRQVLAKAQAAIEDVPQEDKDITSMTMAIDPKNLDRARDMIKKFRRELCAVLEEGEQSRVYNLAVQLYPISIKNSDTLSED
jgi:transcriptional regulator with XRE-family HTH domain